MHDADFNPTRRSVWSIVGWGLLALAAAYIALMFVASVFWALRMFGA